MAEDGALTWSSSPVWIVLVGASFGGFFVFGFVASHDPVGKVFCAGLLTGLLYLCLYLVVYQVTLDPRGELKFRSLIGTRRTQLSEVDDVRLRSEHFEVRYGAGGLAHFDAN